MNFSGGAQTSAAPHRRRRRSTASSSFRHRRYGAPATPLIHLKLDDVNKHHSFSASAAAIGGGHAAYGRRVGGQEVVSARKLAAGLWQLRFGLKCGSSDQFGFEPGVGHVHVMFPCHHTSREYGAADTKDLLQSPLPTFSGLNHEILSKLESSSPYPKSAMEGATKWDRRCSKTSIEASRLYRHMKSLEDQVKTACAASALQSEVVQAWLRVRKLEAEQLSYKKKVKYLLRKLGEEEASWKSREYHIRAVINDLKDELSMERKDRQRVEILNSKLVKEAAEANLSAKQFMQDYEEEKKARDLMEEVCNELAKKIGEDKAEVEALKSAIMKHCEEVEEERKMLQMAEVWREEHVQMKLLDAKLALEDKYSQMNKLVTDLETFLSFSSNTLNVMKLRKAELIRQAVKSVNIQDMKEFAYVPPKSGDIYSIFKEIRQIEGSENHIEAYVNSSPAGGASNYHPVSPEVNDSDDNNLELKHSIGFTSYNISLEEDARGWEKVSHAKGQGSSYSLERSEPFVNWVSRGKMV